MRTFYLYNLKNFHLTDVIKKAETLTIEDPPKKISIEDESGDVVEGFFGFTKHEDGCTLSHYFRSTQESYDPYVKENFSQTDERVSDFSFVRNGKQIIMFRSGDTASHIFEKLAIDSNDFEVIGYDLNYIRFLNESNEKTRCYKKVISSHDLYSLGRYGGNETGHRIKEDYFDIRERDKETKTVLPFVTYAKISVSLSSTELTLILYSTGKVTAVNFTGDYFTFTKTLVSALNVINGSYNDFLDCVGRVNE